MFSVISMWNNSEHVREEIQKVNVVATVITTTKVFLKAGKCFRFWQPEQHRGHRDNKYMFYLFIDKHSFCMKKTFLNRVLSVHYLIWFWIIPLDLTSSILLAPCCTQLVKWKKRKIWAFLQKFQQLQMLMLSKSPLPPTKTATIHWIID